MRKIKYILFLVAILLIMPFSVGAKEKVDVYLFHLDSCPHCAQARAFLDEIKGDYDNLEIHLYEVSSAENSAKYDLVKSKFNSTTTSVPFIAIGETYIIGFASFKETQITDLIEEYSNKKHRDLAGEALGLSTYNGEDDPDNGNVIEDDDKITVPVLGEIDPKQISLPFLAVVIGTIDGFNPCAMWVLLFLISMLLGTKDKKRMWTLGLAFLITSAFVYMLFMLAWLKIAVSLNQVIWIRTLIAFVALAGAGINLRSYFKAHEAGCEIVDDKKRSKIFQKVKKFTSQKSFILALLGVMALAFSVNLIELACSAGLPLIFTQVLSLNSLSGVQYFMYIFLYILFFLIDDIIIFVIAMTTLKVTGFSTKYSKYSHLIGGIVMLIIGLLLILKPEWLMFNF